MAGDWSEGPDHDGKGGDPNGGDPIPVAAGPEDPGREPVRRRRRPSWKIAATVVGLVVALYASAALAASLTGGGFSVASDARLIRQAFTSSTTADSTKLSAAVAVYTTCPQDANGEPCSKTVPPCQQSGARAAAVNSGTSCPTTKAKHKKKKHKKKKHKKRKKHSVKAVHATRPTFTG